MDETILDAPSLRAARASVVLVGASVSAIGAAGAWWLGVPFVAAILAAGAVAGPIAAVRRSRRLVGPGWLGASLASGIEAPFVAAGAILLVVLVAATFSGGDVIGGIASAVSWVLLVGLYAAIFGLPAAVPVSVVAGLLVRRTSLLGPRAARRHLALLSGMAAVVSLVTLADVTGLRTAVAPGIAPIDWARESAAVRLDLTIENRTREEPELEIGWRESDGSTGWLSGAPSCMRSTDLYLLDGSDWYVARAADIETLESPPTLVTAADWPGRDVAITLILEPAGARVTPGASGSSMDLEPIVGCAPSN